AAFFKSTTNAVPVSIINDGTSVSTIGFKGSTSLNEYNVRVGADGNDFISYTNNIERMRINSNGNVGIGTSNPIGLLDVQKSASNAGGQSVVNITGSTWTGDGASVILNQVWNDNYYKTIIDNNGGNYAQTGSGLKIQTSYWDGSKVNSITSLVLSPVGNLGLGTAIPDEKLTVNGKIHAQEVRIDLSSPMTVPDYVFANDYKLKSLQQVEDYIKENSHLPEIPSAKEIEKNGLMLAEMNMALLKKIEELTLYTIEQQKNTEKLIQLLDEQNKRLKILEEGRK
ncbi:hypothetical protein PMI10_02455, partial [Flavobacterium sp. CF136]